MPHSRRRSRSSSRHRRRRHGRDHRRRLDEPRGRRGYPSDSDSDYSSDYYSSFTSSSSDEGDVAAALYERERRKRRKIEKRMRELETMYLKEKVLRDIAPFAKDKDKENNIIPLSPNGDIPPEGERPRKHKYGEYKNVLLTDDEFEKLRLSEMEYSDEMCDEVRRFVALKR